MTSAVLLAVLETTPHLTHHLALISKDRVDRGERQLLTAIFVVV